MLYLLAYLDFVIKTISSFVSNGKENDQTQYSSKEDSGSIENLVIMASWDAVNNGGASHRYYKVIKLNNSRKKVVTDEDPLIGRESTKLIQTVVDDVFTEGGRIPENTSTGRYSKIERGRHVNGGINTTYVVNCPALWKVSHLEAKGGVASVEISQRNVEHKIQSVYVGKAELPTVEQTTPEKSYSHEDNSLNDSSNTPKQYISCIHTVLHSPFGPQENVSRPSFEYGTGNQSHKRVDSWDSLFLDGNSTESQLADISSDSSNKNDSENIYSREPMEFCHCEISPTEVTIGSVGENTDFEPRGLDMSESPMNGSISNNDNEPNFHFDNSFEHNDLTEHIGIAKLCEQEEGRYCLASRSPVEMKKHLKKLDQQEFLLNSPLQVEVTTADESKAN